MSELQNPLFDEEKEFLERKKLEYERALRGDVDHIKDQSVKVGKVAAVGAGLAGGIWLITKVFGGKKRKRNHYAKEDADQYDGHDKRYEMEGAANRDEANSDDVFGPDYYTAGNGKRYKSKFTRKSAVDSARIFEDGLDQTHEGDDLGFGSKAASYSEEPAGHASDAHRHEPSPFDTEDFEDDPFQDLPYDDSRRLPASHAFDDAAPTARPANSRSRMVGAVLQSFLQSDTGKVLVAQVAAVALAVVTKKVSEFFPSTKNPDLATSPGYAPAETVFAPAASLASPDSPDASTHPQSL